MTRRTTTEERAEEGSKEFESEKESNIKNMIKDFTDNIDKMISDVNTIVDLMEQKPEGWKDEARALLNGLPSHLRERAKEGKRITLSKAQGREAFKSMSADQVREWLSDKMNVDKEESDF